MSRQRFNRRVALHRVNGCSDGYKTCEMFDQKVVILRDTYHEMSHFHVFWLLRNELSEQVGCREFDTFFENALICHGIVD